jgi:predicted nucleic acid-binding protein
MTCYAVIDTNILVSALLSSHDDAATVVVVGKLFSGEVIPLFSDEMWLRRHLSSTCQMPLLYALD